MDVMRRILATAMQVLYSRGSIAAQAGVRARGGAIRFGVRARRFGSTHLL